MNANTQTVDERCAAMAYKVERKVAEGLYFAGVPREDALDDLAFWANIIIRLRTMEARP